MRLPRPVRLVFAAARAALHGFGWAFVLLVAAAAGLAWYASRTLSPERTRELVAERLRAALGREVRLERASLSPRGIRLRGLRVGAPGEELLSCETALATLELEALLRRELKLSALRLEAPRIVLRRGEDGVWDFSAPGAAGGGGRGLPRGLAASRVLVERARILIDDRLKGRRTELDGDLALSDFSPTAPFPFEAAFAGSLEAGSRRLSAKIRARGQVDLAGGDWPAARARAESLEADIEGASFRGSAEVRGFSAPLVEARFTSPALPAAWWPKVAGREGPSLPATKWSFKGGWPAQGLLEVEELSAETPAGAAKLSGVADFSAAQLSAELSSPGVDLARTASWRSSWGARAPSGRAAFRASVTGWPGRLRLEEGELSLRGFSAGGGEGRRAEGVDLDLSFTEDFARARAGARGGRLTLFGETFELLGATATLAGESLSLEGLQWRWKESNFSLKGRVDRLSAPKEVALSLWADALEWEDAQRLAAAAAAAFAKPRPEKAPGAGSAWVRVFKYAIPRSFPDTVGRLRVGRLRQANFWCRDLDLVWSLKGVTPALDRASGEARLRFGPGRVSDIPAVQGAHKLLRVIFLPFVYMHKMNNLSALSTATAYPKTLDFNRIEGDYSATAGAATTRYFHVDGPQLIAYAEGPADFASERVDLEILTRLTGFRGTLPEWWVDEAGRPAIGFRVKGDLNRPQLEPRFKKISEGELESRVEEGRARARRRFEPLERLRALL